MAELLGKTLYITAVVLLGFIFVDRLEAVGQAISSFSLWLLGVVVIGLAVRVFWQRWRKQSYGQPGIHPWPKNLHKPCLKMSPPIDAFSALRQQVRCKLYENGTIALSSLFPGIFFCRLLSSVRCLRIYFYLPLPLFLQAIAALILTNVLPGMLLLEWLFGESPAPPLGERILYAIGEGMRSWSWSC
ncbi:MAG: hypothetical protein U0350_42830 [Caldilineaceae bacterium]